MFPIPIWFRRKKRGSSRFEEVSTCVLPTNSIKVIVSSNHEATMKLYDEDGCIKDELSKIVKLEINDELIDFSKAGTYTFNFKGSDSK